LDQRALIAAAQDGDRAAYGELYRRFAPTVHGVLLARVAPDAVNDLLQDVFLKAMLAIGKLHDHDHFGAWLCAIARNCARDFYRDHREQQPPEGMIERIAAPERVTSGLGNPKSWLLHWRDLL
jgi:RNA polymerase sigma-70 factor, ECF subfamily